MIDLDVPTDLTGRPLRTALEARLLDLGAPATHKLHGRAKARWLGELSGTIVELGPGTGANFRYYPDGVRVIGIEPNPGMHGPLRAAARDHGVELEIRTLRGEDLDVDDGTADAVVGTLVLCGVDDPAGVLREVRRALRPGGSYVFVEHVAATAGTALRRAQGLLQRPHRWLFNGCDVTRDTEATIRAAGFTQVEVEDVLAGPEALHVRTQIRGRAIH